MKFWCHYLSYSHVPSLSLYNGDTEVLVTVVSREVMWISIVTHGVLDTQQQLTISMSSGPGCTGVLKGECGTVLQKASP